MMRPRPSQDLLNQPNDLLAAGRFCGSVDLNNGDVGFGVVMEDASVPRP